MATTTQGRQTQRGEPTAQQEREEQTAGDGRHPRSAAEKAARHNSTHLHLPIIGEIELPPKDELAYLGGLAVLGVVGRSTGRWWGCSRSGTPSSPIAVTG